MADPPRHRGARPVARSRQSETRCRRSGRARTPYRPRADGRVVQGRRDPLARLAGAGRPCMKITYRDATPADAAVIDRIFDTSFCDTFAHLYAAEDLDVFLAGFNVADWRRELEDPAYEFRIGEVNGEPVGYVKLGPMKLPIETNRPALVLDQLYILKEHHGVGIAHALMDWTVDRAKRRGAEELFLTV